MAAVNKIDSNFIGLRYCEEASPGVLDVTPANQTWVELEPNSFGDFGGSLTTLARRPINPGRQAKKGVVVDLTASGAWQQDLTQTNFQDMGQGFFFANIRNKKEVTGSALTVTASSDTYGLAGIHTGSYAGDIILVTGCAVDANNGVKNITTAAANALTVSEALADETTPTTAKIVTVGFKFASGDAAVDVSGDLPKITTVAKDCTQLGLLPGEMVYIGGDSAADNFATAACNGYARVRSVSTNAIVFDKTSATWTTDAGTSKQIRLWKGRILKNEIGSDIVRRTYRLEALLAHNNDSDTTKEQALYIRGWTPGELTFNFQNSDKLTMDFNGTGFSATTIDENVSGANSLLSKISGVVRSAVVEADAFNAASDVPRVRLARVVSDDSFPTRLFTYAEEFSISLNNNLSELKAVGVLGALDISAGLFAVTGSITAYFSDVASMQAIQDNADITFDVTLSKANSGIAIDLPLITLGGGLPSIEQDAAIKIPLDMQAASGAKIASTLNHTAMIVFWDYLPTVAATSIN